MNKQFACGLVAIAEAHTHTHAARITHTLRNCNIRCHFIAMRLSEFSNTSVLYSEFPRLQFHIFEFMRLNLWLCQHPASSTNNFHFIRALCKHASNEEVKSVCGTRRRTREQRSSVGQHNCSKRKLPFMVLICSVSASYELFLRLAFQFRVSLVSHACCCYFLIPSLSHTLSSRFTFFEVLLLLSAAVFFFSV